jgi:hypothetical protein
MSAVERHVGGKDHRRNADLAFEKPNLRTLTKPATNAGRMGANVNAAMEKPKY